MKRFKLWVSGLLCICVIFGGVGSVAAREIGIEGPRQSPYLQIATEDNYKWSAAAAYDTVHNDYMVVWETVDPSFPFHHSIYGRRVSVTGQMSAEFLVYSGTYNSLQPDIAYDPALDRYLIVWSYDSAGDGLDLDIYGRFIPWNGPDPNEPYFGIDTSRGNTDKPKVSHSPTSSEYMVIWRVLPPTPADNYAIAGGIINNDRTGVGFPISSGPEARDFPRLAYNLMRNEFVVVWDVDMGMPNQDLDIHAVRLDYQGNPQPPGEFAVTTSTSNEQHPAVAACSSADNFFIVWQQQVNQTTDDNLCGAMLTGSGNRGQSYCLDSTTAPQQYPALSCNPGGNEYFLVWQDMYAQPQYMFGIWGGLIEPNFNVSPPFEIVRPSDTRDRKFPAIAYGNKSALVVWQHARDNSGFLDIWGQVIWPHVIYLPMVHK